VTLTSALVLQDQQWADLHDIVSHFLADTAWFEDGRARSDEQDRVGSLIVWSKYEENMERKRTLAKELIKVTK